MSASRHGPRRASPGSRRNGRGARSSGHHAGRPRVGRRARCGWGWRALSVSQGDGVDLSLSLRPADAHPQSYW